MKVSIIMPIYNVEKYLAKAIESILKQTFKDWELILVNDGSIDNSPLIAASYASKYSYKVKLINQKNKGLSEARNTGLKAATGKYVIFVDSDDYIEKNMLEELVVVMERQDCDVVSCGSIVDVTDDNDNLIKRSKVMTENIEIINNHINGSKKIDINLLGFVWNKMYRRSVIGSIRFEKGLSLIEDIVFNYKVLTKASKIKFISKCYYHYMKRPQITLSNDNYDDKAKLLERSLDLRLKLFSKWHFSNEEIQEEESKFYFIHFKANLTKLVKAKEKAKLNELIKQTNPIGLKRISSDTFSDKVLKRLVKLKFISLIYIITTIKTLGFKGLFSYQFKNKIKYLIGQKMIFACDKKDAKIIVFMAANYANLGDIAISEYQVEFLKKHLKDRTIIEVPIDKTYKYAKSLKKIVSKNDLITIIGGGHISDVYEASEEQKRFIIKNFKHNKIVIFPQTMYFTNTKEGKISLNKSKKVYASHKNLTIVAREKASYKLMKKHFKNNKVIMSPDIVLSATLKNNKTTRKDIVVCLRNDQEKAVSSSFKKDLLYKLRNKYGIEKIKVCDTHLGSVVISKEKRNAYLNKIFQTFKEAEVVITDRLHGMIFCVITNTPCLVLKNNNGKVENFYNTWFTKQKNIKLVSEEDCMKNIKSLKEDEIPTFDFTNLESVIKE